MIHHVWSILCSRSVTDIDSKNVSIQNVIEQLAIPGEPSPDGKIAIPMELLTFWTRAEPDEGVEGEARISFLQPSGEESELLVYPLDLENSSKLRTRVQIAMIPVPEAGRYKFCIEYRLNESNSWQKVAQIPLDVIFQPQEND